VVDRASQDDSPGGDESKAEGLLRFHAEDRHELDQASSLSAVQLVAAICADQQRRWRSGDQIGVEYYLERFSVLKSETHAIDLICNEWVLRQQSGQPPRIQDWLARFPDWKEALERQPLFQEEGAGPRTALTQADPQIPGEMPHITSGTELGEYVVIRLLGTGGMGQVFKALHKRMDRFVAIKVLALNPLRAPESLDRFRREMKVAASLNHPNIVTAFDAGEFREIHYLVMEYVEGETFAQLLRSHGPVAPDLAVGYILQAARGLAYAHSRGVIHRDIKPANLLLSSGGIVKILDMGIARLTADHGQLSEPSSMAAITRTGSVLGTIDFMAPEQAEDSGQADARSDIYSLGCTLYTLIAGKLIYEADTLVKRIIAHRQDTPPSLRRARPTISPRLDHVFRRMVAKRPADRYASADELIAALENLGDPPATSRGWWIAAAAALAMVMGLLFFWSKSGVQPTNPPVEITKVEPKKVEPPAPPEPLPVTFTRDLAQQRRQQWSEALAIPATERNSLGMRMQLIPPGEFEMGSPADEIKELVAVHEATKLPVYWKSGFESEGPRRRVTITQPFYLAATEVTIGQFAEFVGDTGHRTDAEQAKGGYGRVENRWELSPQFNWKNIGVDNVDDWPVFNVSYRDAAAFCQWLSKKEGKVYRLPTEAEWEYACRAGTDTRYPTGNNSSQLASIAWYNLNSGNMPHPVGQLPANSFGLSDLLGNVWEWCADWHSYDTYQKSAAKDPTGPDTGTLRVMRGGSYYLDATFVRPACRIWYGPSSSSGNIGFRVARDK